MIEPALRAGAIAPAGDRALRHTVCSAPVDVTPGEPAATTQIAWFLLAGGLLVLMAFAARWVERLPLSPALAYLAVGFALGPGGAAVFTFDFVGQARAAELLTETTVLVSLFAVGLRLRLAGTPGWRAALRLASLGMVLTTLAGGVAAWALLGLAPAAALLLAGALAPTDPVLASDVQVKAPDDRDAVRQTLSAEGGINDGTAFPAIMLALGLYGLHEIGASGWRWLAVDVVWAVGAALAIGWGCGFATGRLLERLRRTEHLPQHEEFLVLGVIGLTYGLTLLAQAYGFIAVFTAALALAHVERRAAARTRPHDDPTHSLRLLHFTGQCERLLEMVVVVLVGIAIGSVEWRWPLLAFGAALLVAVRPLVVYASVPRSLLPSSRRRLIGWFGIRGVGTLYYLSYAFGHGVPREDARTLLDAALATIALSIVAHGVSATPLMEQYRRRRG